VVTKEVGSGEESLNGGFSGQASILSHSFEPFLIDEVFVVIAP